MSKSTRKKATKSVLVSQKPRRKSRTKISFRTIFILLVVAGGFWGVTELKALIKSEAANAAQTASASKPINWKIGIVLEGKNSLPNPMAENILKLASSALGQGSPEEMRQTAELVQQEVSFEQVSIIKTGLNTATLYLNRRKPVMCIEADRLRLVTSTGDIYGEPSLIDCPGPILSGVFVDKKSRFITLKDMTVGISQSEREIIRESSELLNELTKHKYQVSSMEFHKFRGFGITIKDLGTTVTLGQSPFGPHLDRLDKIMAKLKSKNQIAERIELDYQGKAFIKLKKM